MQLVSSARTTGRMGRVLVRTVRPRRRPPLRRGYDMAVRRWTEDVEGHYLHAKTWWASFQAPCEGEPPDTRTSR